MEITKEQFQAYERVREGGVTNMWDVGMVCRLTKLSREMIFEIMRRYGELDKQYPDVGNKGGKE